MNLSDPNNPIDYNLPDSTVICKAIINSYPSINLIGRIINKFYKRAARVARLYNVVLCHWWDKDRLSGASLLKGGVGLVDSLGAVVAAYTASIDLFF